MEHVDIAKLVTELGSSDQAAAYRAGRGLTTAVEHATGAQRAELAKKLAAELVAKNEPPPEPESKDGKEKRRRREPAGPKHSAKVRREICRYLSMVAGEEQGPILKSALEDLEIREAVRWALDRVHCQCATDVLIQIAVDGIGDDFRLGAIGSLRTRPGSAVVEALKKLAKSGDATIRVAAADSLAEHPTPDADQAFEQLMKKAGTGSNRYRRSLVKARLRLAANLVSAGQKEAGKKVYQAVLAHQPEPAQKKAAERGLKALAPVAT